MLRVVRTGTGIELDERQVLPGRGAYVHDQAECVDAALRRGGLARTLRTQISLEKQALLGNRGRRSKDS